MNRTQRNRLSRAAPKNAQRRKGTLFPVAGLRMLSESRQHGGRPMTMAEIVEAGL